MPYALLAGLVLVTHLGFIVLVIFGGFLFFRWTWAPLLHLPAFVWGAWIEFTGGICPLTPLENRLRRSAGGTGYEETFIEHYIVPVIYPPGLTASIQTGLGVALVVGNALVYGWALRRRMRPAETTGGDRD